MRSITAPRLISGGGTGGKRSCGVYCVQLALGGVQQSSGRLTDEGLHLQLLAIKPRQPPSRPVEGPIHSAAAAADGTVAVEMVGHRCLSSAATLAFHFLRGLIPKRLRSHRQRHHIPPVPRSGSGSVDCSPLRFRETLPTPVPVFSSHLPTDSLQSR